MSNTRYARQIALFGQAGHDRLADSRMVLLGVGGLGMHVVQQLAYLGIRHWTLADSDTADDSNLNRLVGAFPHDVGTPKVHLAARLIESIQPGANVTPLEFDLPHHAITAAIDAADLVIGAFDKELPRLAAVDLCSQAGRAYVDLATEVISTAADDLVFGGRVVISHDGTGCLDCLNLIDQRELAREQMTPDLRQLHDRQYGISRNELGGSGPSVVTVNGVVASLATTEVMCLLTGLRPSQRQLTYRGDLGTVRRDSTRGRENCPFCERWRKVADAAADSR
ncbi:putative UBA/THIF-type NAD/FAD binding protein [uncultured Mycobacterium sp.]|uniref:Putative UBA/THIF-type NAD/FAD binding protein n=1 Tax=uncultured Mycobacterium sp. TaxID=171292 RepID=A0A1Y5PJW2_9MYCO|nr:putative UBA/THIF-type NAD/FAD binding protein [uncultured Mycobacterium sp.]